MKESQEFIGSSTVTVQRNTDFLGGVADCCGGRCLLAPIPGSIRIDVSEVESNCLVLATDFGNPVTLFWSPLIHFLELNPDDSSLALRVEKDSEARWVTEILGTVLFFCRNHKWFPINGMEVRINGLKSSQGSLGPVGRAGLLKCLAERAGVAVSQLEIAKMAVATGALFADEFHGISEASIGESVRTSHVYAVDPLSAVPPEALVLPRDIVITAIQSGETDPRRAQKSYIARTAFLMGARVVALESGEMDRGLPDFAPSRFHSEFSRYLPEKLRGLGFMKNYGRINDTLTKVHAPVDYPIRAAVRFAIEENFRVRTTMQLLSGIKPLNRVSTLKLIGEFMLQSHHSYGHLGLGVEQLDLLVSTISQHGSEKGLYGARISGAGCGGPIVVLMERNAMPDLKNILQGLGEESGMELRVMD